MWDWEWEIDSRRLALAAVALVLLGAAAGALLASAALYDSGTPAELPSPQPTALNVLTASVNPDSRLQIGPSDGRVVVSIEPGSVTGPVEITVQERSPALSPRIPPEFSRALRVFEITGEEDGRPWSGPFSRPIAITMAVDEETQWATNGDLSRLVILHLEQVHDGWVPLQSSLSNEGQGVWARAKSLSLFALATTAPEPAGELPEQPHLPVAYSGPEATPTRGPTDAPTPTATPSPTSTPEPTVTTPTQTPSPQAAPAPVQRQSPTWIPRPLPVAVPTPVPTPVPSPTPQPTDTPTPRPTPTLVPTPTREPGWRLFVNARQIYRETMQLKLANGVVWMYQLPYEDGRYRRGSVVSFSAEATKPDYTVTIHGADSVWGDQGQVHMDRDRHVIVLIEPKRTPTPTPIPTPEDSQPDPVSGESGASSSVPRPEFPDAERIVFHSDRDGDLDIYVMGSDGSSQTPLTQNDYDDHDPSISPDGSLLAFVSNRDGNKEIYAQNGLWGKPVRLTNDEADDLMPAVSPTGDRILFVSQRDGNPEVYAMDADGNRQTRLTINRGQDLDPAWSPSGDKIMFASDRNGKFQLFTITADGFDTERITTGDWNDRWPSWSKDADNIDQILFASDRPVPKDPLNSWEVWIWYRDGTSPAPSTSNEGTDDFPVWSPSGGPFLVRTDRDGDSEIYGGTSPLDGPSTNLTKSPSSEEGSPSWATLE